MYDGGCDGQRIMNVVMDTGLCLWERPYDDEGGDGHMIMMVLMEEV